MSRSIDVGSFQRDAVLPGGAFACCREGRRTADRFAVIRPSDNGRHRLYLPDVERMTETERVMFQNFFSFLKEKIFSINDTPHKIALGFGLGVFTGILPGTGPVASLVLAFLFRANRAAALAGSLLTNTWVSFVIFLVALQTGSYLTGTDWQEIYNQARELLKDFHWDAVFSSALWPAAKSLLAGYLVAGLLLGFLGYAMSLGLVLLKRGCSGKK